MLGLGRPLRSRSLLPRPRSSWDGTCGSLGVTVSGVRQASGATNPDNPALISPSIAVTLGADRLGVPALGRPSRMETATRRYRRCLRWGCPSSEGDGGAASAGGESGRRSRPADRGWVLRPVHGDRWPALANGLTRVDAGSVRFRGPAHCFTRPAGRSRNGDSGEDPAHRGFRALLRKPSSNFPPCVQDGHDSVLFTRAC